MKFIRFTQAIQTKRNRGFTLIELLVVIIILGVLTAISIPTYIDQVGKARELNARNLLGAIGRSQQAYHFEKRTFASDLNNLSISGLDNSNYYTYPAPSVADTSIAKHQAIANDPDGDQVKNYALGIYHNSGLFITIFCQAIDINEAVEVGNTATDNCTNNGIKIQ